MDSMLIDSTASTSARTVRQRTRMSATVMPYRHGYDITQSSSTSTLTPGTSSLFKWADEDGVHRDNSDGNGGCNRRYLRNEEDAFTGMSASAKRRNACPFDADAHSDEAGRCTEWVYLPDEVALCCDAADDVPGSASSSASVWPHSGVASTASTSVDSLGLHHVTLGDGPGCAESSPRQSAVSAAPGPDAPAGPGPVYDRANFATASDSIWTQHELSELDIAPIPPSSGTLVNWNSPLASCCAMDEEDDIGRLLGQKRPRDAELDELVERYKRRRTLPELWVQ